MKQHVPGRRRQSLGPTLMWDFSPGQRTATAPPTAAPAQNHAAGAPERGFCAPQPGWNLTFDLGKASGRPVPYRTSTRNDSRSWRTSPSSLGSGSITARAGNCRQPCAFCLYGPWLFPPPGTLFRGYLDLCLSNCSSQEPKSILLAQPPALSCG